MNHNIQDATFHFAASQEEREAIFRLRYRIYVEGMHIFEEEADHEQRMLFGENDETARLLYARIDGEIVGALRLNLGVDGAFTEEVKQTYNLDNFLPAINERRMLVITRFMVTEPYRGSVLGFNLIAEVAKTCIKEKIELAFCDCQPHLVSYYQRIGFKSYACDVYNDSEFGIMAPLALVIGDAQHLKSVNSPLLHAFSQRPTNTHLVTMLNELFGPPAVKYATTLFEDQNDTLSTVLSRGKVPLFDGLSREDISRIIVLGHVFDCAPNDRVIRKGQPVTTMYILLAGTLEIKDGGGEVVYQSKAGEVIGEMAMLLVTRRTADVYAGSEGARLLSLNEKVLQQCFNTPSKMSSRLLLNLSKLLATKLAASSGQEVTSRPETSDLRFV